MREFSHTGGRKHLCTHLDQLKGEPLVKDLVDLGSASELSPADDVRAPSSYHVLKVSAETLHQPANMSFIHAMSDIEHAAASLAGRTVKTNNSMDMLMRVWTKQWLTCGYVD